MTGKPGFCARNCSAKSKPVTLSGHHTRSKTIPVDHALRACLALKFWLIERKSHVMALVADQGQAFRIKLK